MDWRKLKENDYVMFCINMFGCHTPRIGKIIMKCKDYCIVRVEGVDVLCDDNTKNMFFNVAA